MKKLAAAAAIMFLFAGSVIVMSASPAEAYPCNFALYRAGKVSTDITVATGVSGVLRTPFAGTLENVNATKFSIGDIYLINGPGTAFVQLGWYVGGNGGDLTYTAAPRLFWGENVPGGELLHPGTNLSWDTFYSFKIYQTATKGIYNLTLQGILQDNNTYVHSIGIPGFNGEVDYECSTMEALASHAQTPLRTLQYLYNNTWGYWDAGNFNDPSGAFFGGNAGDIATNYAQGGGS